MDENEFCEYCDERNEREYLRGDDGVVFDKTDGRHYLYIEHFRNERYNIKVNYCPKCGRKLELN